MTLIKRLTFISFTTAAFIFSTACNSKKQPPAKRQDSRVIVDVIIAGASTISNTLEVNGTVIANEYAELHPEVSGRLTYLNVPEGKSIPQGTVIARINDADLQAQLNKSQVQLELAKQTEERLHQLLDIKGVNQADYDAAISQVNNISADISYTRSLIDKTVIRAPFSGVAGLRQVSPGAYVTPATIIASMQQVSKVKIDFTLPEAYSASVQKGTYVDVLIDEANSKKHKALIIASEPQVDVNTRNLKVRAMLQDTIANPGSFVKVNIVLGKDKSSVLVPTNAIIPDAMNKKMVIVKNGNAVFVDVETGVRKEGAVEVTKGLQAGDTVVVSGVLFAKPNAPVQIRSVKQLKDVTQ